MCQRFRARAHVFDRYNGSTRSSSKPGRRIGSALTDWNRSGAGYTEAGSRRAGSRATRAAGARSLRDAALPSDRSLRSRWNSLDGMRQGAIRERTLMGALERWPPSEASAGRALFARPAEIEKLCSVWGLLKTRPLPPAPQARRKMLRGARLHRSAPPGEERRACHAEDVRGAQRVVGLGPSRGCGFCSSPSLPPRLQPVLRALRRHCRHPTGRAPGKTGGGQVSRPVNSNRQLPTPKAHRSYSSLKSPRLHPRLILSWGWFVGSYSLQIFPAIVS